jgi:hypothetical protein
MATFAFESMLLFPSIEQVDYSVLMSADGVFAQHVASLVDATTVQVRCLPLCGQ